MWPTLRFKRNQACGIALGSGKHRLKVNRRQGHNLFCSSYFLFKHIDTKRANMRDFKTLKQDSIFSINARKTHYK